MGVNLTVSQIAVQLRIVASESDTVAPGQEAVLANNLATACAMVKSYAPKAPRPAMDEAAIRICGYLYDKAPHEGRGGNPMILSGAAFLLAPFRARTVTVPTARSELTG